MHSGGIGAVASSIAATSFSGDVLDDYMWNAVNEGSCPSANRNDKTQGGTVLDADGIHQEKL